SHAQTSGAGTDRAGGTRLARRGAAGERMGDGQLQRDAIEKHEARAESGSESGHVRKNVQRASGFHRGSDGIGAEPAASGKCHGKLRESGAAHSREDRAGPDFFREGGSAAGNERGRDGGHEYTRNKDRARNGHTVETVGSER